MKNIWYWVPTLIWNLSCSNVSILSTQPLLGLGTDCRRYMNVYCVLVVCIWYISHTYPLWAPWFIPGFFFGGISITHLFICLCYLLCLSSFCLLCLLLPISVLSILLIPTAVFSSVYAYMDIMIFSRALFHRDTSSYLLTCDSSCCMS